MYSTKLSVVPGASPLVAALCALLFAIAGCSTKPTADPTAAWSPNKIYAEAKDEVASGAFDKAVPLYEKLEGRAAGTPLAQQAQIEKAHAQYKAGEQAQAMATLDRFIKLHPASPALDYALYLKGLVNFNDNRLIHLIAGDNTGKLTVDDRRFFGFNCSCLIYHKCNL